MWYICFTSILFNISRLSSITCHLLLEIEDKALWRSTKGVLIPCRRYQKKSMIKIPFLKWCAMLLGWIFMNGGKFMRKHKKTIINIAIIVSVILVAAILGAITGRLILDHIIWGEPIWKKVWKYFFFLFCLYL